MNVHIKTKYKIKPPKMRGTWYWNMTYCYLNLPFHIANSDLPDTSLYHMAASGGEWGKRAFWSQPLQVFYLQLLLHPMAVYHTWRKCYMPSSANMRVVSRVVLSLPPREHRPRMVVASPGVESPDYSENASVVVSKKVLFQHMQLRLTVYLPSCECEYEWEWLSVSALALW